MHEQCAQARVEDQHHDNAGDDKEHVLINTTSKPYGTYGVKTYGDNRERHQKLPAHPHHVRNHVVVDVWPHTLWQTHHRPSQRQTW
eukprot:4133559-Amphidinium_carterae.1